MLVKMRTPIASIAYKIDSRFPEEIRKQLEIELSMYLQLFSVAIVGGDMADRFRKVISGFCEAEHLERMLSR